MQKEALVEQIAELSKKNTALLEELSLAHENASLAQENARLAEQNAFLKMSNLANAVMNPYERVAAMPAMLPHAPPGLALPAVNTPDMLHVMPPHGIIPPAFGGGYNISEIHDPAWRGPQRQHGSTKPSVCRRSRLTTPASVTASSRSRGSSMSSMCSMSKVSSTSSISSKSSMASTVASSTVHETVTAKCDRPPTAVMMKNVPDDYTREQLLEVVDAAGFQKDYDIVSVPIDILSGVGLGYAFINFTTHAQAEKFKDHFHEFKDWQVPCNKGCETSWSDSLKGYDTFIERYRNSPVMHESVTDAFKPALYKDGVRMPFPEPTKTLKPPRLRRRERGGAYKVDREASNSCLKDTELWIKDDAGPGDKVTVVAP